MGAPKSSVYRDLTMLVQADLAAKDDRGWYHLGDDFVRLAFVHHRNRPQHLLVSPVLRALSEEFGETAHCAVLDGDSIVYRDKVVPETRGSR